MLSGMLSKSIGAINPLGMIHKFMGASKASDKYASLLICTYHDWLTEKLPTLYWDVLEPNGAVKSFANKFFK